MLDVWLKRTRQWLSVAENLLPLPEQEFAGCVLHRLATPAVKTIYDGNPATICGERGSGKSALIRQAFRACPGVGYRKILLAEAVEWNLWIADALETGRFALDPDQVDVLVCENLHGLHAPAADGDRLALWLDRARRERIPVIVTSDRLPSLIPQLSRRLTNRLQGGVMIGIRPLSAESQLRLGQHWSSTGGIPATIQRVHVPSSMSTAGQLRQALTQSTVSTATDGGSPSDELSLEMVADLVAREFQVSVAELCSGSRTQNLKIPRGVAMTLARELTMQPLLSISRYFGCRSHTAVARGCSRLQQLLPETPSLRQQVQLLRAKLRHELSADCG